MLGTQAPRPHVLEFIRGTGVVLDGVVVDASAPNGPWTRALPDDVLTGLLDLGGGGQGGQGGGDIASAVSTGGGSGGQAGVVLRNVRFFIDRGASFTVTLGAKGLGGAVNSTGQGSSVGGDSSISGLRMVGPYGGAPGTLTAPGGGLFVAAAGASASAAATVGGGGTTAGAAATDQSLSEALQPLGEGVIFPRQPNIGRGGGGNATPSLAGGAGAAQTTSFGVHFNSGYTRTVAAGTTTGSVSRGGGGQGQASGFGRGGNGGSGAPGEASPSYSGGGGGGGGQFPGGDAGEGCARILYYSER